MNTGLQDAANLSWKLGAVVRGRSPQRLLDTYHAERHPVGRTVLRSSGALVRLAMARSRTQQVLRDAVSVAVSAVRPLSARALGMVSGVGIAYRREHGAHRLTGTRAPDLTLRDGRLYEALRARRFVLVLPGGQTAPPSAAEHDLTVVHRHDASRDGTALLVRPDGYVAWAGAPDAPDLRGALTEWTGTPTRRPSTVHPSGRQHSTRSALEGRDPGRGSRRGEAGRRGVNRPRPRTA